MKRNVLLSAFMLTLLFLLSCDLDVLNSLLIDAREKFLDENKNNKGLHLKDENQKDQEDVIIGFEGHKAMQQFVPGVGQPVVAMKPVNREIPVLQWYPYNQEEKIEIKEEDLIPDTDYEKRAQKEIDDLKSALRDSNFDQLIEEARKLQIEYAQLESSFYDTLSKLRAELNNKKGNSSFKNGKEKPKLQKLIQFRNQLNEERDDIDMLRIKVDSGFDERSSAKYFFEKSQKTLKEAITERLKNKRRSRWAKKGNIDAIARRARSEAESAFNQLESASSRIGEVIGRKKEIEELIKDAESVLGESF
ncbi:P12 family lipoprotein [Borrelia hispanica]|uniref:P12 family lipoprotein n=1 Tax=Borrelia hispanica TaxID=40835 RepID=UPI0004AE575B|nr:P12 family lipoprotein [Borrelia hispanica]